VAYKEGEAATGKHRVTVQRARGRLAVALERAA
jgi:hypothetical protein